MIVVILQVPTVYSKGSGTLVEITSSAAYKDSR